MRAGRLSEPSDCALVRLVVGFQGAIRQNQGTRSALPEEELGALPVVPFGLREGPKCFTAMSTASSLPPSRKRRVGRLLKLAAISRDAETEKAGGGPSLRLRA